MFRLPPLGLTAFNIQVEFLGTWTNARRAVFEAAAVRCLQCSLLADASERLTPKDTRVLDEYRSCVGGGASLNRKVLLQRKYRDCHAHRHQPNSVLRTERRMRR